MNEGLNLNQMAKQAIEAQTLLTLLESKNNLEKIELGYNAMLDAVLVAQPNN